MPFTSARRYIRYAVGEALPCSYLPASPPPTTRQKMLKQPALRKVSSVSHHYR
ncbi:hypothetical protein KCP76_10350 [Salmonella enterica subsp. enterica serovar Weltevreden]|nr:hypothetical protein KCP76_10350 [Salmonella enterica subsp. enterica serovar Weltevreden]